LRANDGAKHLSRCAAAGILNAFSLYHRSSQLDAAIVADVGVVEAVAGGAVAIGLAAELANSISRSNTLHKTYAPVDIEAVRNTDAARLRGRQWMRAENESGAKVSKEKPAKVSNSKPSSAK
jgi:hypothetical protein